MSTRRTLFTLGALVTAVALLAPAVALAQPAAPSVRITSTTPESSYNKLKVAWAEDAMPGVTGYRVYYRKEMPVGMTPSNATGYEDVVGGAKETVTLRNLEHDTLYYAAVASMSEDADDVVGDLVASTNEHQDDVQGLSAMTDLAPEPSTPRNVTAMGGDETFTLSWDAPYSGGKDLTIKEYRVQKREVAGSTLTGDWIPEGDSAKDDADGINMYGKKVDGDMTTITFEDLENGVSYEGRVMVVNSAGQMSEYTTRDGDAPDDDATATVGDEDGDGEDDMTETPALPLFGILALFGGLLAAGRARLRR